MVIISPLSHVHASTSNPVNILYIALISINVAHHDDVNVNVNTIFSVTSSYSF